MNARSRQHARTDGQCKQTDRSSKKKTRWKARDQNTVTEIEDIFDGLIIRLDTDEERSSDLKDISVEVSEAEK